MWLIVGLGNPGPKYSLTRHNIGFLCIDQFVRGFDRVNDKTEHKAITNKVQVDDEVLLLARPQTFMNLSGESVSALMKYYRVPTERLIVVHDEIDIPFGTMKLQVSRGHGGHNGIRDIHAKTGSKDYIRLRLGVGRSANPHIDTATHVLQNFSDTEMNELSDFLNRAGDALCDIVTLGFQKAATSTNREA